MSDVAWPDEPPTEQPPLPEEDRAVVPLWTRLGTFGLELVLVPCTFAFGWVGWWIVAWADGQTPAKFLLLMSATISIILRAVLFAGFVSITKSARSVPAPG